jgi:hypothetical protein
MFMAGVVFLVGLAILVVLRDALPMIGHIEAATVIMALAASVIGFVAASQGPVAIRTGSRIAWVLASAVLAVGIALQGIFGDDGEPLFGLIDPGWTFWWSHLAFMGLAAVLAVLAGATQRDWSAVGWLLVAVGAVSEVVFFALWTWYPTVLGYDVDASIFVLEALGTFGAGATLVGVIRLLRSQRGATPVSVA